MRGFSVILSDGHTYNEWELEAPGWINLKNILKNNNLKIIKLKLIYDNQYLNVEDNAATYFYKKRVKAWLDLNLPFEQDYGIGATNKTDVITVAWYDGSSSQEELRKIDNNDAGFIFNEKTS